jgi:hypothetical protein
MLANAIKGPAVGASFSFQCAKKVGCINNKEAFFRSGIGEVI